MWTIIMFEFIYVDGYNVRVCLCGRDVDDCRLITIFAYIRSCISN